MLRYAAEFFAPAFPRKKSMWRQKGFVASLQQLQDALGVAVNEKLLEQIGDAEKVGANRHGGRARKVLVSRLSGLEEARIAPALKVAERAYAAFAKVKPFWV